MNINKSEHNLYSDSYRYRHSIKQEKDGVKVWVHTNTFKVTSSLIESKRTDSMATSSTSLSLLSYGSSMFSFPSTTSLRSSVSLKIKISPGLINKHDMNINKSTSSLKLNTYDHDQSISTPQHSSLAVISETDQLSIVDTRNIILENKRKSSIQIFNTLFPYSYTKRIENLNTVDEIGYDKSSIKYTDNKESYSASSNHSCSLFISDVKQKPLSSSNINLSNPYVRNKSVMLNPSI
jgi:hypothetical protein